MWHYCENKLVLSDLRFWQWYCWRVKCSGLLHCCQRITTVMTWSQFFKLCVMTYQWVATAILSLQSVSSTSPPCFPPCFDLLGVVWVFHCRQGYYTLWGQWLKFYCRDISGTISVARAIAPPWLCHHTYAYSDFGHWVCQLESNALSVLCMWTGIVDFAMSVNIGQEHALRPPHMLRFDLRLACAVSKRKVRWSVCGIKTTYLVSLYRLRLGTKEVCRRLIFLCVYRQVSEQVWACVVFYGFTVSFVLFLPDV